MMHSRWTTLLFHSFFLCLLLWIELFGHETQVNSFGFGQGPHGLKQNHPSNSLEPSSASTQISEGLEFGPRITVISNTQEYLDFLAQDDRLCVIKFYASWCKSCQKFGLLYKRLARQLGDIGLHTGEQQQQHQVQLQFESNNTHDADANLLKRGDVRFAEIEFSANSDLCRSLGIKKLPNIHIYKHEDRITGFPCGPSKFGVLEETLEQYLNMKEEDLKLAKTLEEGGTMVDQILLDWKRDLAASTAARSLDDATSVILNVNLTQQHQ